MDSMLYGMRLDGISAYAPADVWSNTRIAARLRLERTRLRAAGNGQLTPEEEKLFETSDRWVRRFIGFKERRFCLRTWRSSRFLSAQARCCCSFFFLRNEGRFRPGNATSCRAVSCPPHPSRVSPTQARSSQKRAGVGRPVSSLALAARTHSDERGLGAHVTSYGRAEVGSLRTHDGVHEWALMCMDASRALHACPTGGGG